MFDYTYKICYNLIIKKFEKGEIKMYDDLSTNQLKILKFIKS